MHQPRYGGAGGGDEADALPAGTGAGLHADTDDTEHDDVLHGAESLYDGAGVCGTDERGEEEAEQLFLLVEEDN